MSYKLNEICYGKLLESLGLLVVTEINYKLSQIKKTDLAYVDLFVNLNYCDKFGCIKEAKFKFDVVDELEEIYDSFIYNEWHNTDTLNFKNKDIVGKIIILRNGDETEIYKVLQVNFTNKSIRVDEYFGDEWKQFDKYFQYMVLS